MQLPDDPAQIIIYSELFHAIPILITFFAIAIFLVVVIKSILDYNFKVKMLEKGISEQLASKLLYTSKNIKRQQAVKWAIVLGGTGMGVFLVALFPPLNLFSLVIILGCMSASFLIYSIYISNTVD